MATLSIGKSDTPDGAAVPTGQTAAPAGQTRADRNSFVRRHAWLFVLVSAPRYSSRSNGRWSAPRTRT
jgi:hypothetical protein